MKLDVLNDSLASTDISKMSVNVDNLTYSLMIDGIYTNKLSSVIRELSTNARDSHINANNNDPFLITIKFSDKTSDILLSIKDFGTGLSKEETETYLCNLNASSKRESNDAIGCFGIGSKSPFSLVDSYDFKCVKDNVLTNLNLFRINSETPRFLIETFDTTEPNSVECLLKIKDYSLTEVLKNIYVELALFDIKPNIQLMSETVNIFIKQEDFFCTVIEEEEYYHLFYKECLNKDYDAINLKDLLYSFFIDLKNTKKISCGIIGYKSDYIYSDNLYHAHQKSTSVEDFYILKFGLNSEIKFDVSRENINEDTRTHNVLISKILSDTKDLDLQQFIKLYTLILLFAGNPYHSNVLSQSLKTLISEIYPEFLSELESELYIVRDLSGEERAVQNYYRFNKTIDYNFLFLKLEESLTYYKDNLKDLGTISFISKFKLKDFKSKEDTPKARFLNFILGYSYNSMLNLNCLSIIEKIVSDSTLIWEELYLKNTLNNYSTNFNFLETILLFRFSDKYYVFKNARFKVHSFLPETIKDLTKYKIELIPNYKRLKSQTELLTVKNIYKHLDQNQNTSRYFLNTTKDFLVSKELTLNLLEFNSRSCINVYPFDSYEENNPNFVNTIKYKAPSRLANINNTETETSSREIVTHNELGLRLRNKFTVDLNSFNSTLKFNMETTSLKFYEYVCKNFNSLNSYHCKRLLLISKDIIKNEEEKKLFLSIQNETFKSYLIRQLVVFEIDNLESYEEIKNICTIFLQDLNFNYQDCPILELSTKFNDEDLIKNYSKILIWMYNRNINYSNYSNFLNLIEEDSDSVLMSHSSEEESPHFRNYNTGNDSTNETMTRRKGFLFTDKLNISINNPYTNYSYSNFHNEPFHFKGISVLLNESLKDLEQYSLVDSNYNEKCFHSNSYHSHGTFFNRLTNNTLPLVDFLLISNDCFLYKRLFNQNYLKFIEDNYNKPIISFNIENLKTLLKEY